MNLHELSPAPGSTSVAKRKGRGHATGNGKTAGRGHKGQKDTAANLLQILEGSNLAFLAAQTQLFAGKDFLLSAWLEEDTLHGTELLGSTEAAPGILRAMGCKKGTFQIPGNHKPYAMIHKLHDHAVVPKYFGFSFD